MARQFSIWSNTLKEAIESLMSGQDKSVSSTPRKRCQFKIGEMVIYTDSLMVISVL